MNSLVNDLSEPHLPLRRLRYVPFFGASCVSCHGPVISHGYAGGTSRRYRCKQCLTTFTNTAPWGVKRKYLLSRTKEQRMWSLLKLGFPMREVSRQTGIHQATIAKFTLKQPNLKCGCGQELKHRGWCDFRTGYSPIRQAYYKLMSQGGNRVLLTKRPSELVREETSVRLIQSIDKIVPKSLPVEIRDRVKHEIATAMFCEKITVTEAHEEMSTYVREAWGSWYGTTGGQHILSLDAPLKAGEPGFTLLDVVPNSVPNVLEKMVESEGVQRVIQRLSDERKIPLDQARAIVNALVDNDFLVDDSIHDLADRLRGGWQADRLLAPPPAKKSITLASQPQGVNPEPSQYEHWRRRYGLARGGRVITRQVE